MEGIITVLSYVLPVAFIIAMVMSMFNKDKHARIEFLVYAVLFKILDMQIATILLK